MRRNVACLMLLIVIMLISASCSNSKNSSGDWTYNFVVWKSDMYITKNELLSSDEISIKIGEIEEYSDIEGYSSSGVFSNKYPKGTEIYSISDVSEKKAIAIKHNDQFIKATNNGKYKK